MLFRSNDTATTEIYTLSLHDALPILASKIIDLAKRPQTAAEMAESGRTFVRDNHSSAAIGKAIRQAIAEMPLRRTG